MRILLSFLLLFTFADLGYARRLTLSQLPAARQRAWQQWCTRLSADTAMRLPALAPLADARPEAVRLPDALEPEAVMRYRYGAKGARPEGGYPLFLYLHGSGAPDDEWRVSREWALRFADAPSAYFIPRIPNTGAWYRWYQASKQWAWERLLCRALASPDIDPTRIYVFGISEGGYGAQRLAAFYADYWAGAGPMAGGEPLINAPVDNCEHLAFSLLTGSEDTGFCRNRLTRAAAATFDSARRAQPDAFVHRIAEIEGAGHGFDYRPTTPWLAAHRRVTRPRRFTWENFPMGGRYRTGFYNLAVVAPQPPAAPSPLTPDAVNHYDATAPRRVYTFSVKDNTVDLTVDEVTYAVAERDPTWGIPLRFTRTLRRASGGKVCIYLDDALVDLRRPISVRVNGRPRFAGRLVPRTETIARAIAEWHDPMRLYPACVEVTY